MSTQEVDSVEYGLTDIQEYYANTGALRRAAETAQKASGRSGGVGCSIVEAYGKVRLCWLPTHLHPATPSWLLSHPHGCPHIFFLPHMVMHDHFKDQNLGGPAFLDRVRSQAAGNVLAECGTTHSHLDTGAKTPHRNQTAPQLAHAAHMSHELSGMVPGTLDRIAGGPSSYPFRYELPDTKPKELEEVLRLEYRSKLLNPRWAEAMVAQGSGGAYEVGGCALKGRRMHGRVGEQCARGQVVWTHQSRRGWAAVAWMGWLWGACVNVGLGSKCGGMDPWSRLALLEAKAKDAPAWHLAWGRILRSATKA
eukprot:365691-Chlamydomonas_euryale.AAC.5